MQKNTKTFFFQQLFQVVFDIMTYTFSNRIIVHGRDIISSIVPGSAQPFNFKENFHLTEEEVNMFKIILFSFTLIMDFNPALLVTLGSRGE